MGQKAKAIKYAESCRSPWASDRDIDCVVRADSAIERSPRRGVQALRSPCHTGPPTSRPSAPSPKAYPQKQPREILADLVETTPGDEGKWFAAAKEAGLYDEALELAGRAPCDPKTLTRAARDLTADRPAFAVEGGAAGPPMLAEGYGYEITGG